MKNQTKKDDFSAKKKKSKKSKKEKKRLPKAVFTQTAQKIDFF